MSKAQGRILTILAIALGVYGLLAAGLFLAQRSFIYPAPRGPGSAPGGFERVSYPTVDGLTLDAGYKPGDAGEPTILYFHGNGADWQSSVVGTDHLVPQGYGVLAAEYRGYPGNPGLPSEHGLYEDGRAAIAFLKSRGIRPEEIVIIGNSLGSGVAVQMAGEIGARGLVLISPFASLSRLVAEKLRWLPTRILLRDRFENLEKIAAIEAPILILHGDADTLIPVAHARALARAQPRAKLTIFRGYGHELAWREEAEARTLTFLEQIGRPLSHPAPYARGRSARGDVSPGHQQP